MTPLHAAALAYAARGVPVFPVEVGGKRPLAGSRSYNEATTDLDRINQLWGAGAEFNIGTVPAASGLRVVDVDDKNGHHGSASWAALCPEAPATLTVRTPSGGLHLYFRGTMRPSAGKLGDGLDIRSEDSYVLLPPSTIAGVAYTVINHASPAPWPLAEAVVVDHEPAKAPEGVELDPFSVDGYEWGPDLITRTIEHDGPAEVGRSLNQRTLELAMRLGDGPQYGYAISEDEAVALMLEWWSNADRIEETVRNAYRSRENPLGCGQVGSASRTYDPALGVRPYNPERPQVGRLEQIIPEPPAPPKLTGLVNGSTIMLKSVTWFWPGWLAAGKLQILGGQAGAGKSTIGFSLLAQFTAGGHWPDGSDIRPSGDVLIWSGEDDAADTILPRFIAAGGNRNRVWFPGRVSRPDGHSRAFDPAVDMAGLAELVQAHPEIKVVMIDPIVSAVGGDSHNNAETRKSLQPVVDFAVATGTAVLGITHFTKGTQGKTPLDRITGSLAFGAMSRVVWGAEEGETTDDPRKLVRIKSNIGRTGDGFTYTLQRVPLPRLKLPAALTGAHPLLAAPSEAQRVVWGPAIEGSAQQLLQGGEGNKEAQAILFLQTRLSNGAVLERDMRKLAGDEGLTDGTLKRAKKKLGVMSKKGEGSDAAPWYWLLPPPAE